MVAATGPLSLRCVDLLRPDADATADLREACSTSGIFEVSNHGLEALIERHFEQTRAFFSLPMKRKMDIMIDSHHRGYTPMDYQTLDPDTQKAPDNKEGLYFGVEVGPDSEDVGKPLCGPNQWPDVELLPDFRPVLEAYFEAMLDLGRKLMRLLALCLDLPPTWFLDRFQRPIVAMRPLRYGAQVSRPDEGFLGAGAHTDWGVLTLLATCGQPGLQVMLDGTWRDVACPSDTIVVNVGDLLERWTRGAFHSPLHRVAMRTGRERLSTAFFLDADFDCIVDPADIPDTDREGVAKQPAQPPITQGAYLLQRFRETMPKATIAEQ